MVIAFVCAALWLHGTSLALFDREAPLNFGSAARTALWHLLPLFVIAIAAALIYGVLAYWHDSFAHKAFVIGSYTTMKLRKPVPPSGVLRWYHGLIWLLRWLIVPAVLFPLAAAVARFGWRGFHLRSLKRGKNVLYWLEVCALLLLAIWVPFKLFFWVPQITPFAWQMVSFLARLGSGYLLFVAALLSLEFLTSAGKPPLTQPSTTSSP